MEQRGSWGQISAFSWQQEGVGLEGAGVRWGVEIGNLVGAGDLSQGER